MTAVVGPGSGSEGWTTRGELTPERASAQRADSAEEPNASSGAFGRMLGAVGREIDQGEALVSGALSGAGTQSYSSVDLIVLQAGIYRYTEAVELAGRLVDRAGQAIKTTLQGSSG
jgi:hypothetical protein